MSPIPVEVLTMLARKGFLYTLHKLDDVCEGGADGTIKPFNGQEILGGFYLMDIAEIVCGDIREKIMRLGGLGVYGGNVVAAERLQALAPGAGDALKRIFGHASNHHSPHIAVPSDVGSSQLQSLGIDSKTLHSANVETYIRKSDGGTNITVPNQRTDKSGAFAYASYLMLGLKKLDANDEFQNVSILANTSSIYERILISFGFSVFSQALEFRMQNALNPEDSKNPEFIGDSSYMYRKFTQYRGSLDELMCLYKEAYEKAAIRSTYQLNLEKAQFAVQLFLRLAREGVVGDIIKCINSSTIPS